MSELAVAARNARMRIHIRSYRPLVTLALLLATPFVAYAQRATGSTALGFAPDRLARIDGFLQQYVDSNRIGGAVGFVLRDGKVAYERSVGWSDKESGRRMTPDAIFRIASQSKALTSAAVLMLVEEGRIALGDPVSRFIPAYAHTTVASRADSGRTVVPAKRQITIKDLLTHTAGISYGTDAFVAQQYAAKALGPAAGWGWYTADKDEPICSTMERLATLPFGAPVFPEQGSGSRNAFSKKRGAHILAVERHSVRLARARQRAQRGK